MILKNIKQYTSICKFAIWVWYVPIASYSYFWFLAQITAAAPFVAPFASLNTYGQAVGGELEEFVEKVSGARECERVVEQRARHQKMRAVRWNHDAHVERVLLSEFTRTINL